jgi:hypothetical protein
MTQAISIIMQYIKVSRRKEQNMMPLYSTGPIENAGTIESRSSVVHIHIENTGVATEEIIFIQVFKLNGMKTVIAQTLFSLSPERTITQVHSVAATNEFEVQVTTLVGSTLVSVWGVNAFDAAIPQHRLVLQEMTIVP